MNAGAGTPGHLSETLPPERPVYIRYWAAVSPPEMGMHGEPSPGARRTGGRRHKRQRAHMAGSGAEPGARRHWPDRSRCCCDRLLSPHWALWTMVELPRAWLRTIRLPAAAATRAATTAQYTRAVRCRP